MKIDDCIHTGSEITKLDANTCRSCLSSSMLGTYHIWRIWLLESTTITSTCLTVETCKLYPDLKLLPLEQGGPQCQKQNEFGWKDTEFEVNRFVYTIMMYEKLGLHIVFFLEVLRYWILLWFLEKPVIVITKPSIGVVCGWLYCERIKTPAMWWSCINYWYWKLLHFSFDISVKF